MNKKVKAMLLVLCALILVVGSVMGTFAYLTDTKEVVNTFTVGDIKLKLDEAKVDAETGKAVTPAERTADGNPGVKMLPGRVIDKDPTVTVLAGSEESYVRMIVTLNYAKELKEIFGNDFLPQNYVSDWDNAVWQSTGVVGEDTTNNTLTYEFRYVGADHKGSKDGTVKRAVDGAVEKDIVLAPLFKTFTMPGSVTGEQLAKLVTKTNGVIENQFKITVVAHAIQAEGFDTADLAWAAFTAP